MFSIFKRNRAETNRQQTDNAVKRTRDRWFGRIRSLFASARLDDALWDEIEEILISADVGYDTTSAALDRLRSEVRSGRIADGARAFERLKELIAAELAASENPAAWLDDDSIAPPYVILVCGVNGVGKTTSIAKLARHFTNSGQKVVLAAADTFRAAAEEQLEILGQRAGVPVISHQHGADPGAVAYDAWQAAKARQADILIIDTAGRLHTRHNLMDELRKIRRVINSLDSAAPHQVILTSGRHHRTQRPRPGPRLHRRRGLHRHLPRQAGRHRPRRHRPRHPPAARRAHTLHRRRRRAGRHHPL